MLIMVFQLSSSSSPNFFFLRVIFPIFLLLSIVDNEPLPEKWKYMKKTSRVSIFVESVDSCPEYIFDSTFKSKVIFSEDATYGLSGQVMEYDHVKMMMTCNSNTPSNCMCSKGDGTSILTSYGLDICCTENGMSETWKLQTDALPNHFASIVHPLYHVILQPQDISLDIPTCPHRYLDLDNLPEQDETNMATLGVHPVGFALNGVPFYGPFTHEGHAIENSDEIFDKCNGQVHIPESRYSYRYGPVCVFGHASNSNDCRYHAPYTGYHDANCLPYGFPSTPTVVGYAVDGFPIYVASYPFEYENELDNCNGKFTYNAKTRKYSYGYYITSDGLHNHFPYVMGCLGPGTRYKISGKDIDYNAIKGKIDTDCYSLVIDGPEGTPPPTNHPTGFPTERPTLAPTLKPTPIITATPTRNPTHTPTRGW